MDFFRAQDDARRKTWRLLALFALAVAALVVLTNILVGVTLGWFGTHTMVTSLDPLVHELPTAYWPWVTFVVVSVVSAASLYKYLALRSGGRAVAGLLDGRRLDAASVEPGERRLLNVVEELAIASGTPVPPAYVIPDPAINAFAAGHGPDDAIVAVTEGALRHLTRDELQGVIGHEFSHILNGDSRLNLRLVAALHGILFIGLIGRGLARGTRVGGRRDGAALGLLGVGLIAIGYSGTFCGNLIKAAVSRQREFLADAASVQFTRNPDGIAGALKKIGAAPHGSTIASPRAGEISHLFFAQALKLWVGGLFATHPPLAARIRAIEPRWNGEFPTLELIAATNIAATNIAATNIAATNIAASGTTKVPGGPQTLAFGGTPESPAPARTLSTDPSLAAARTLIADLATLSREAAHEPWSARALCYALLLGELLGDGPPATNRVDQLDTAGDPRLSRTVGKLHEQTRRLAMMQRLTLVAMSMPALKQMSEPQYRFFVGQLVALIKADRRIDLFEWVLHRLIVKELRPHFEAAAPPRVRYSSLEPVATGVAELISAIVRHGGGSSDAQRAAFALAIQPLSIPLELVDAPDPDFNRLNGALKDLRSLAPLAKPRLLKACAAAVSGEASSSGATRARATDDQLALLTGIAAALDCPLPPDVEVLRAL